MIWLSEAEVEELLDPAALVAGIEEAFRNLSTGAVTEPAATRIDGLGEGTSYLTVFPSYRAAGAIAAAKVLAGRRDNPAHGRPEIDAVVVVADAGAARIRAVIAARAMTALRTAATTAVAIRHLRPGASAMAVGLVGTGAQGRAHARILAATGLAERFLVAAPASGLDRAEAFAAEVRALTGRAAAVATVARIAAESEAIITATLAQAPLLGAGIRRDVVIASVGPFYPGETEIAPELPRSATAVVSDHPARLQRQWAGVPGMIPDSVIALGDLVSGQAHAPERGLALFLSDGRAFEDNVAAGLVLAAAERRGRGLALT